MLLSINTLLLSIFAPNERLGADTKSFLKRYRILSIIYINLILSSMGITYELVVKFFFGLSYRMLYTPSCIFFAILCFYLLKKGKNELAGAVIVLNMHSVNFITGFYYKTSMLGYYGLMIFPNISSFLTQSSYVRLGHALVCCCQGIFHVTTIAHKFQHTITVEQSKEISTLILGSFMCLLFLCISSFIQKSNEDKLWRVAHCDFEKMEKLAKEVVQTIEARDVFISSFAHEIKNPLNSMNGGIDYLLTILREAQHLQVLKDIKLSSEILINLTNNMLAASKLKSDKLELTYVNSNFEDIVRKVFIINSENFRRASVFAQGFIDQTLPEIVSIDSSRIIQVVMNLVSNALKFTPKEGNISIYVQWCPQSADILRLLDPIEDTFTSERGHETRKSAAHVPLERFSSLLRLDSFRCTRIESSTLKEFTMEEAENRRKNLQSIKIFETKPLGILNNSFLPHLEPEIEQWAINKSLFRPCERRQLSSFSHVSDQEQLLRSNSQSKKYIKVQISDTGCGIPDEDIPKLFEMFSQTHYVRKVMGGGTGLGLWICKQLCKKMNGDITMYSKVNQGTTIVFYVPVNTEEINSGPARPIMRRDTVNALVVDDYDFNRDLHKLLLEREGVQVTLAADGKEAFERYKMKGEDYFDFIMMDIQMPIMDGFTAAKSIRDYEESQGFERKVDICFVSGEYFHEEEVLAKFKTNGGDYSMDGIRCLKKPVDVQMIGSIVKKYKSKERRGRPSRNGVRGDRDMEIRFRKI